MHSFTELIDRCTVFTIDSLYKVNETVIKESQTSGATSLVKTLQMIQLQKTIFSVGMFSIFESILQESLSCKSGFDEAKKILIEEGEIEVKTRFNNLILAINVLKHGKGPSYNALILNAKSLPFKIKLPDEQSFSEGDVSEVSTLIQVDDAFLELCGRTIREVTVVIQRVRSEFF
ncbi:MAG: hypothetical protein IPM56_14505 [Ignavibacteriales bacterium]|nr:MAG: hypothetical protein IPM56_14505 [Ignavibacteriales bacterium]